jgi:hypothetical protein
MDFEILSEITEITKIAVGSSIRDIAKLRRNMEEDAGEN